MNNLIVFISSQNDYIDGYIHKPLTAWQWLIGIAVFIFVLYLCNQGDSGK